MGRYSIQSIKTPEGNIIVDGIYRFSIISSRIIRVEKDKTSTFEDLPTQIVFNRNVNNPEFTYSIKGDKVLIVTKDTDFLFDKKKDKAYVIKDRYMIDSSRRIGNLKGTLRTLDMTAGLVHLQDGIFSKQGVTQIDDSKSYVIDEEGNVKARTIKEKDIYVLNFGQDFFGGIKEYYSLTGHTPLLPKYVLGNWWSRYYAYTQDEYINVINKFEEKKVPLTVATIDMDWHIVKDAPKDGKTKSKGIYPTGWTGYTWNEKLFPDYKKFLKNLKDKHLGVTLNLHPCDGVRYYEKQYEEMCKACDVDPTSKDRVPFNLEDEKFRNAYFDILHHPYEKDGVDFWWIDWQQGKSTPLSKLDPLWLLNHYHTLDIDRDGNKGLILSRFCGPGSHRYPLGFSGDSIVVWKSLQLQPYMTATASNIGYTWWSHDIGGHQFNHGNPDLYVRWLQFGVFSPINRLHSSNTSLSKEPWNYPEWAENIAEDYLRLRHQMLPYLYTANVLTAKEGVPLMMPMYWKEQSNAAYKAKNQYYFGSELIVAPVINKAVRNKKTGSVSSPVSFYIPAGTWTDFFTGKKYKNGWYVEYRSMDNIPVFAKEGAIVPMLINEDTNTLVFEKLEIKVFAGENKYTLYDEQGEIEIELKKDENTYILDIKKSKDCVTKSILVHFVDLPSAEVAVNGKKIATGKKVKVNF